MADATTRPCWICGAPSDSREHKIKKSDLVRRYGCQPFRNIGGVLHFVDGESRKVPGPRAKTLTYDPLICSDCNNAKSQPWDNAYQIFERWLFENEKTLFQRRFILLEEVFGSDAFSNACPELYKYFVKAFGCRLSDAGFTVPQDLVLLLPQAHFLTKLRIAFAINKTVFALPEDHREIFLGIGDLIRIDSRTQGVMERYVWHMQIGWLRISFFYDTEVPCGIGAPWTSDSACLYLGEFETSSLDELIEGARRDGAPGLTDLESLRANGGIRIE